MPIPRFYDENKEVAYEKYWFCSKCKWSITTNAKKLGKSECVICGGETKLLRIEYPDYSRDPRIVK